MSSQPAPHPFVRALDSGALVETSVGMVRIAHRHIGSLHLPSGRIVASDPMVDLQLPAFARRVTPGRYPVHIAIAQVQRNHDERIAAAWLRFGDGPVAVWEVAMLEGQRPSKSPTDTAAYGVDSGTGSFFSAEAATLGGDVPDFSEMLADAMDTTYRPTRSWASLELDQGAGVPLNVVSFSSGWGDGGYASWWGLDATGAPLLLLTDFAVLDDERSDPTLTPGTKPRPWWKFWGR
ncbi:DUF4241 domain-containing protein [Gemmatimonas sp.]